MKNRFGFCFALISLYVHVLSLHHHKVFTREAVSDDSKSSEEISSNEIIENVKVPIGNGGKENAQIPEINKVPRKEMNELLTKILKSTDESQDPCENFYQYSCGKFLKNIGPVNGFEKKGVLQDVKERVQIRIDELISKPIQTEDLEIVKNLKDFYKSCKNFRSSEGVIILRKLFRKTGGFPAITPGWKEKHFDLLKTTEAIVDNGLIAPFPVKVHLEFPNNAKQIVIDFNPLVKLDYEKNESLVLADMVKILRLFRVSSKYGQLQMNEVLKQEIGAMKILRDKKPGNTLAKLVHLEKFMPYLPWKKFLLVHLKNYNFTDQELENTNIILLNINYGVEYMKIFSSMPKQLQSNLLHFKTILHILKYFPLEFPNLIEKSNRAQNCLTVIKKSCASAFIPAYINEYKLQEKRNTAYEMLHNIEAQYLKELIKANYTQKSIGKTKSFLKQLTTIVGFNEIMKDSLIEEYYSDLQIKNLSFFQAMNHISTYQPKFENIRPLQRQTLLETLKKFFDASSLFSFNIDSKEQAFTVSLFMPMLESPFFSADFPESVNYARLGHVYGHELAHGIITFPLGLDEKTSANKKCIVNQYDNYTTSTGVKISGKLTYNEDVADLAGIQVAYNALIESIQQNFSKEIKIPDFKYSPRQLYWISAASMYCEKVGKGAWANQLISSHPPPEIRFNAAFANFDDFARDFSCKIGTKMNPKDKCLAIA